MIKSLLLIMSYNFIFFVIFIFFVSTKNAFAYLDPGTFTIIINFLIALFAGIVAYVTMFWRKMRDFFSKIFKNKKNKE